MDGKEKRKRKIKRKRKRKIRINQGQRLLESKEKSHGSSSWEESG